MRGCPWWWGIWFGDAALATLAGLLAAIGTWEYFRLARATGISPIAPLGIGISALLPIAVHAHMLGLLQLHAAWGAVALLLVLASSIWTRGVGGRPLEAAATTVFGVLYTSVPLGFVYALRYHPYAVGPVAGALTVLFPIVLTWASDVGAYACGRLIGGRKFLPSVSPGKTVAGAVGAVVTTVAVAWIGTRHLLAPHAQLAFTPTGILIMGVVVSIVAQIGDLAESLLKREAGVKDSGALLPGHGGALDRLDSLYFVMPTVYLLYDWLLIPAPGAR